MTLGVGKKLSLFMTATVLASTALVGYASFQFIEAKYAEILRKDTLDAATLLSSRIRNELGHVADRARTLTGVAQEQFKSPAELTKFLEESISYDDQLVAVTLHTRAPTNKNLWGSSFRITRPEGDALRLSEDEFKQLDLKYPLDLNLVSEGAVELNVGTLKDGTPILRLAVPIERKKGVGLTQILGIEVKQERITSAFAEATAHFSYVLDRTGKVLLQTDATHFTLGEDLSYLPILQMARSSDSGNGNLDFSETPGGTVQYGSFHKVGYADLTIVTQAPATHLFVALRSYARHAGLPAAAALFLVLLFSAAISWWIVGSRLTRLGTAVMRIGEGRFGVTIPEVHSGDEIGAIARKLQSLCDELQQRDRVHGTIAKLKARRGRHKLHDHKLKLKGDRLNAFVLNCHLHGIEAVTSQGEPELLIKLLNRFNQSVSDAIESNHGIVDHIHGGSIIAYWGVPAAEAADADHALLACLEVRKCVKALNESLKKAKFPEVSLGMGMHHGTVIAGQVGTEDRLEYTVMGDAFEVAARIQSFTDQFGTDFLMTGQAVDQAPKWYSTERVSSGDEGGPELFELVGILKRNKAEAAAEAGSDAVTDTDTDSDTDPETETETETANREPVTAPAAAAPKKRTRKRKKAADNGQAAAAPAETPSGDEPAPDPESTDDAEQAA